MNEHTEDNVQQYNTLLMLWQAENPIKTIKLQFLLATNVGLVGFMALANEHLLLLGLSGVAVNIIWTLSIGRTSLFQEAWKNKLDEIALQHPNDRRFQILNIKKAEARAPGWLRTLGGVSSKYYLIGTPMALTLAWLSMTLRLF